MSMTGTAKLGAQGKETIAVEMFVRGRDSAGAALLLRPHAGHSYMYLYLLCQSFELIGKSLLLLHDYDSFKPKLKSIGHDLVGLLKTCETAYGVGPSSSKLWKELADLNDLYKKEQRLRYAGIGDIFVDPRSIPCKRVQTKLFAAMRLALRRLPKTALRP